MIRRRRGDCPAAARVLRGAATVIVGLGLGGCTSAQPLLDSAGPVADSIAQLGVLGLIVTSVVALLVFAMLLYPVLRAWQGRDEPLALPTRPITFVLLSGVAFPMAVLALLYGLTLPTLASTMTPPATPALRVEVTGHQWWWEVRYLTADGAFLFVTANEIHIPAGVPVRFDVRTADVIHSFWVPRLGRKIDLIPGRVNSIWLQADEPGTYTGQCAEYCGQQHAHMGLLVVAEGAAAFEAWLEHQRAPGAPPADTLAARGRDLFVAGPCALCHTVRGTPARGKVGPDLTHVGSRRRIAAGMLENTRGNLAGWIVDAQHIKPGVRMPSYNMFRGSDLRALAAYLESLEEERATWRPGRKRQDGRCGGWRRSGAGHRD